MHSQTNIRPNPRDFQLEISTRVASTKSTEPKSFTPQEASRTFRNQLTEHEQTEILKYKAVYFVGPTAAKVNVDNGQLYTVEGVYQAMKHDHIAYRYETKDFIGEGTFSQVFSGFDHKLKQAVALKIIKNLHSFYARSQLEIECLSALARTYKASSHAITLLDHFTFRGHRVLVFPLYNSSLYQLLESTGFEPLPLSKISTIAYQLFSAISQVHRLGLIHCDLKPHNVVIDKHFKVTVIDFGSACYEAKSRQSYLQSKPYRAPEIILGCEYSTPIDIWSIGCILIELSLGVPLFRGATEQELLQSIIKYRGHPPFMLLPQARKAKKLNLFTRVPIGTISLSSLIGYEDLYDLIDKCLEWDQTKRITATQALRHPLFRTHAVGYCRRSNTTHFS